MKLNKLLIAIFVFILLVSSVYAECPPDCGSSGSDYDYGSDDSYSDPNFYTNSDPSQWDYSKVDWEKVDFSRAELYGSSEFYNNIPDGRYGDLDYKQVEYSQIKDHSKIDSAKYFQDMGCLRCSLALDIGGQNVIFSKNGITHPNGNSVSVPGTYPSGSLFVATEDRIEVVVPEDAETISVPTTDTVTVNTQGRDVTLADGARVNGRVISDNGQIRVEKEDRATINDITIASISTDDAEYAEYVDVFFNGRNCGSDCLSFSEDSKSLFINMNKGFQLTFQKGNPVLNIEDSDLFYITPSLNTQFQITNRDEQDLVPQVIAKKLTEDAKFEFINGNLWIVNRENKLSPIMVSGYNSPATTTPMVLTFQDSEGNNLLGTETEPKKILISNYNELATIPSEKSEGYTTISESYDYAPSLVNERLSVNYQEYTVESFKKEFPNINVEGELNSVTIKRLTETLKHLPPETRDSIRGFEVLSIADWITRNTEVFGDDPIAGAYTDTDRIIRIPEDELTHSLISHEAAHDLTFRIKQEEAASASEIKLGIRILDELVGQFEQVDNSQVSFEDQWKSIAGDVYGKDLEGNFKVAWTDGSNEPRNGVVGPYGATHYLEDIADFGKNVDSNPDFYKPLITPDSTTYDARYRQKLDLLYQKGFITKERYEYITEGIK